MGIKSAFKKLWLGVKVAAPYLGLAASFLPGGSLIATALMTIESLIESAEETFAGTGTGAEKAEAVSLKTLAALEILTGKNVDNPKTRAIVDAITTNIVKTKNMTAELKLLADDYVELAKDLKDAIDDAKEPAQPDAP